MSSPVARDAVGQRQQLMGEGGQKSAGVSAVARQVVQAEGVAGLYAGLSAAAARQLSYGNLRLGIYSSLKDALYGTSPAPPPAWATLGLGCVAGGTAAFLSNPVEVTLVRMQADGRLLRHFLDTSRHFLDTSELDAGRRPAAARRAAQLLKRIQRAVSDRSRGRREGVLCRRAQNHPPHAAL